MNSVVEHKVLTILVYLWPNLANFSPIDHKNTLNWLVGVDSVCFMNTNTFKVIGCDMRGVYSRFHRDKMDFQGHRGPFYCDLPANFTRKWYILGHMFY